VPALRVAGAKGGGLPLGKTLVLAPNPARGSAEVRVELSVAGELRLRVYSLDGSLVMVRAFGERAPGPDEERLDLSGLPTGTYLLVADVSDGSVASLVGVFKFANLR